MQLSYVKVIGQDHNAEETLSQGMEIVFLY